MRSKKAPIRREIADLAADAAVQQPDRRKLHIAGERGLRRGQLETVQRDRAVLLQPIVRCQGQPPRLGDEIEGDLAFWLSAKSRALNVPSAVSIARDATRSARPENAPSIVGDARRPGDLARDRRAAGEIAADERRQRRKAQQFQAIGEIQIVADRSARRQLAVRSRKLRQLDRHVGGADRACGGRPHMRPEERNAAPVHDQLIGIRRRSKAAPAVGRRPRQFELSRKMTARRRAVAALGAA